MLSVKLKITQLRKKKGVSQKDLATVLGVSYQTVSKWENDICMPDICLLPSIAQYFNVSVDELLGLKQIQGIDYMPAKTDAEDYWGERKEYLQRTRNSLWNMDYFKFLVDTVWKIDKATDVIDFGCGYGFLGGILLPLLPEGSTYTGIDINQDLLMDAERYYKDTEYVTTFIHADLYSYQPTEKYDMVICQAFLRHMNNPEEILGKMINTAKDGGLVACIDVNRELENDGIYIDGIAYSDLCEKNGIDKLWKKELQAQGRDYSIGIKLPILMHKLGLREIDVRMNDKVNFIHPQNLNYEANTEDFIIGNGFENKNYGIVDEQTIAAFMNRGMDRNEAELYCKKQKMIAGYLAANKKSIIAVQTRGLFVSYGTK